MFAQIFSQKTVGTVAIAIALVAPVVYIAATPQCARATCGRCWNGQPGSDYTDRYQVYHCMPCGS